MVTGGGLSDPGMDSFLQVTSLNVNAHVSISKLSVPHLLQSKGDSMNVLFYKPHLLQSKGDDSMNVLFYMPHLLQSKGDDSMNVLFYMPQLLQSKGDDLSLIHI